MEFVSGDAGDGDAMHCVRVSQRAMRVPYLWSSGTGESKGAVDRLITVYLS